MAMTSAMRRLHRRLPAKERYPLTPRELQIVKLIAEAWTSDGIAALFADQPYQFRSEQVHQQQQQR